MRPLFKSPLVKILTLCIGLGVTGLGLSGCGSREERAQAYYERGMSYLEKKDYVKARIEFRNALQRKARPAAGVAGARPDRRARAKPAGARRERCARSSNLPPTISPPPPSWRGFICCGNALDQALKLANAAGEIDPKNADVLALEGCHSVQAQGQRRGDPRGAGCACDRPRQCRRKCHSGRHQAFAGRCRRRAESACDHIERPRGRPRRGVSENQYFQPEG